MLHEDPCTHRLLVYLTNTQSCLCNAIKTFNEVPDCEQLTVEGVQDTFYLQCKLSSAIKKAGFLSLLDGAYTVDKASLLTIPAPQVPRLMLG